MKILTNKFVIIGILAAVVLLAWYYISSQWKKYEDWGAMRWVIVGPERSPTDPLFNSTGLFTREKPKVKAGETVEVKSDDDLINKRFMVLDVIPEPRTNHTKYAGGYWIATDGFWGAGQVFDKAVPTGKYRAI